MRFLKRNANWVATPALLLLLVWIWDVYVQSFGVSPLVLPRPGQVWDSTQILLADPKTLRHIGFTLFETLAGFAIAIVVGVLLGAVLGKSRWLERTLNPFIVGLQVMPKIALVPLFIIWFGFGPTSKVVMAAVLAFFPIMTNTILGMAQQFLMNRNKDKEPQAAVVPASRAKQPTPRPRR